ncbi:MAG TPA: nucleotide sugar dehydrogenase, partial [Candidatus Paceibacterota bacterium]|nr:nucleotide sugar dehydrogenase [Candidatus Paceibacterota bacterium]
MNHTTLSTRNKESASHPLPRATRSIAVVGLGYVGLPLAILAHEKKLRVTGFDVDQTKVEALKKRDAPFLGEAEHQQFAASDITVDTDESVLDGADAYIICVPTPVDEEHRPDLEPLRSASRSVGRHIQKGALVVVESTVNPGACEEVSLPIIEQESGLKAERDFFFAHCPERINPGDVKWNVRTIPRVIGATGPKSLARALELYRSIIEAEIVPMGNIKEAEAVKMVENSFRDVNIAFVNELAMSFTKAGIDIVHVLRGASTKPFAFL